MLQLSLQSHAADVRLIKSGSNEEASVDERINKKVEPVSKLVSDIIFYSFSLKKQLEFDEIISEGDSRYRSEAPFDIEYSANFPTDEEFLIEPYDEESFVLIYRFEKEGNLYEFSKRSRFGEPLDVETGDGESFLLTLRKKEGNAPVKSAYKFKLKAVKVPFVLIWLILGAIVFTIYFKFINIRGFKLAIDVVSGRYTDPKEKGEVSHFQALTAALSGTVGLGNIAGVAIAIGIGGPGATFWMIVAGLLGMSSKFTECTLGVKYRDIDYNGTVYGGPMYYLSKGLKEKGWGRLGKVLAAFFAIMTVGGSFGGGNMFQVNQAFKQFSTTLPVGGALQQGWVFGILLAILVALVIIGGIKSIARVTEKIVPLMVVIYVLGAFVILFTHYSAVPHAFGLIFSEAWGPKAVAGGFVGVLIQGFRRAAFSNEAGIGSASIAHAAVKTENPASEGIVALLEPFIDTIVVCTITALVIIVTGTYLNADIAATEGIQLTSMAFKSVISWFDIVLAISVIFFAFSTMISWSYYGLQSWKYLFGRSRTADLSYKFMFLVFIVVGAAMNLGPVVDFSDAMIFAMAFPNILGLYILMPEVRKSLADYLNKIKTGEIIKRW